MNISQEVFVEAYVWYFPDSTLDPTREADWDYGHYLVSGYVPTYVRHYMEKVHEAEKP